MMLPVDSKTDNASTVTSLLSDFARQPSLHLHKIDPVRRTALLIVMDEADYQRESFLDDRVLERARVGAWLPTATLIDTVSAPCRAPHFIFHQGHTGSTLLSRLLDAIGAFGLREPTVLAEIAALHDQLGQPDALCSREGLEHFLRFMLHVWARTFHEESAPVVKATSHAGRVGAEILQAAPHARAVALSMRPEPYLAVLLAGANSLVDLRCFAQERMRRLTRLFGNISSPLFELSVGEMAAMTWLVERAAQARYLGNAALAHRAMDVDFDDFLADPEQHLGAIAAHFSLPVERAAIVAAVRGPVMAQYSKAPGQAYSPQHRGAVIAKSRVQNAEEIRRGLAWLDLISARSAEAAHVVAFSARGGALPAMSA